MRVATLIAKHRNCNEGCNPSRKSNEITTRVATLIKQNSELATRVATLIEKQRNYNEGCNPNRKSNEMITRVATLIEKTTKS